MKSITPIAALAALALSALPGPAAAQNREHVQMAAELRMLQEQQVQLSLKMDQLLQALTDAMKALNGRIDQTNASITEGFANQGLTLNNMGVEVRAIRANSQDATTRLGELREEVEALRASVTALVTRSTAAPPVIDPLNPDAPPQLAVDQPPPAPLPSTVGLSPTQMYNEAYADYAAGQFSLAITGFEQFIKIFGATSDRADDAQQMIGDAEYAQGRNEQAIAAYNLVLQNYPKGDQVPFAHYKKGLALERLQRFDEARASFELAVKSAPGSESNIALLAKQRLDGLTQKTPPAR